MILGALGAWSQKLDVPLTVEETAGVERRNEPVTFGVPLPKGLLRETERLRLYGPDGKPVAAAFRVASRWWDDAAAQNSSIRWVHADFFPSVPARGRAVYRLRADDSAMPAAPAALVVKTSGDDIAVNTGAVEFTVHKNGTLLDAPGFRGADLVLRSDERIYKASLWPASDLVVEEENALRVVIRRTGSHAWVNRKDKALDYVVRIIAYAGRPEVRIVYSFVNRQGQTMADFVRLDGLWLEAMAEAPASAVRVEQLGAEPRRAGWFQAGKVGVGVRWFWQLYPKSFERREDGRLRVGLYDSAARPQNIYAGVAKTHELMLAFDGTDHSAQLDQPLYALAAPKWYTRDTQAMGRLVESSAEAIRPEYWPLVQKYDRWLAACRDAVLAKRDRAYEFQGRRFDEYGMLNFGDAVHKIIQNDQRPDFGVHWETEYYDFPHALFLHFFRTGDTKSLGMAVEAAAHLADVDISHYAAEPDTKWPGAARTGPGLNHWTRYSDGRFVSSMSWCFYKNESLFDRWLLTGDLWSRDVARESADWALNFNGLDIHHNTRSIGNGMFAMLKAWEVFGEKKYLDRAHWIVDCVQAWQDGNSERLRALGLPIAWDPQFKGGYSHQSWMYGIALEGMAQGSQVLARPEMPEYLRRAADWVFANPREWDPEQRRFLNAPVHAVMLTPGLAYISETSGDGKYLRIAMESFEKQTQEAALTDRLKLFAQLFRNSQRFTWYLSVENKARATAP